MTSLVGYYKAGVVEGYLRPLGLMTLLFFLGTEQSDNSKFSFPILLLCPSVSFSDFLNLAN